MANLKAQYAVIFTSQRKLEGESEYLEMSEKMMNLVKGQKGFISADSLRDKNGLGITVSYWASLDEIKSWKSDLDHLEAQKQGRSSWYSSYSTRICRIEEEYFFKLQEESRKSEHL